MKHITEVGYRDLLRRWRKESKHNAYISQTASNALERFANWLEMNRFVDKTDENGHSLMISLDELDKLNQ